MSSSNNIEKTNINDMNQIVTLELKYRMMIFSCLTSLNILINMDHGTIPAASEEIRKDLNINYTILGTFGSLVYLGNLLGALILTKFIDVLNRKYITTISTILNAICLFTFTKINIVSFLFVNRVIVGIMQSFITIYFPVWIDQFGPQNWKTFMLSVFNITSPVGVIFGYILTTIVKNNLDVRIIVYNLFGNIY